MRDFVTDSIAHCTADSVQETSSFAYVWRDSAQVLEPVVPSLSWREQMALTFRSSQNLKEFATSTPRLERDILSVIPAKEGTPIRETIQQTIWFTPLILIMAVAYASVLMRHTKTLLQEVKEFFYPKNRNDLFNSSVTEMSRLRIGLGSMAVVSASLFCYFALSDYLGFSVEHPALSLGGILLVALAYLAVKMFSIFLIDYTFFRGDFSGILKRSYSTLTTWLGFALFLSVLLAAYAPHTVAMGSLMCGLVVCGCAVLLYVYKILTIFFTGFASLFYLILYLCTLEILPAAALIMGLVSIV